MRRNCLFKFFLSGCFAVFVYQFALSLLLLPRILDKENGHSPVSVMLRLYKTSNKNNSTHTVPQPIPEMKRQKSTAKPTDSSCFPLNSGAWLKGRRHGNLDDPFLDEQKIRESIEALPTLLSNVTLMKELFRETIAHDDSIFVNFEDDKDIRRWSARLVYLTVYYHQHHFAIPEVMHNRRNSACAHKRKDLAIGPVDYECPEAKYLIVKPWRAGLASNVDVVFISALQAGLATNRVVMFVSNFPKRPFIAPWLLASCHRTDFQCFFLPPSPCVPTYDQLNNFKSLTEQAKKMLFQEGKLPTEFENEKVIKLGGTVDYPYPSWGGKVEDRLYSIAASLIDRMSAHHPLRDLLVQAAEQILQPDMPRQPYDYRGATSKVRHALQFYTLRPNPSNKHKLQAVTREIVPSHIDASRTIGMPIRASDKCIGESECLTFSQHIQAVINHWNEHVGNSLPLPDDDNHSNKNASIIFTTESSSMVQDFLNFTGTHQDSFAFSFVTNKHDLTQDTGDILSVKEGVTADEVMLSSISTLQLQLLSKVIVSNCCSGFHRMMNAYLYEGAGAASQSIVHCLQEEEDPHLRVCCGRPGVDNDLYDEACWKKKSQQLNSAADANQLQPSKGAFVILAQNKPHPLKGRDSNASLKRTLDFLYKNYNARFHDDVIIVHEGDFDDASQSDLRQGRGPELKFHTLATEDWEVYPMSLRDKGTVPKDYMGYRHMVRFFAIRIWSLMARMGYKYVARLDDDSLILSAIDYNIFDYMADNSIDYAYRCLQNEDIEAHWYRYHQEYMKKQSVTPKWTLCNSTGYDKKSCGRYIQGFYNNFFVAKVDRFLEGDIQDYLRHIDETGVIYERGWGDLFLQSMAVKMFVEPMKTHRFTDWAYAHHSGESNDPGNFYWGIIQFGKGEGKNNETCYRKMNEVVQRVLGLRSLDELMKDPGRRKLRVIDGMYTLTHPYVRLE